MLVVVYFILLLHVALGQEENGGVRLMQEDIILKSEFVSRTCIHTTPYDEYTL